MREVIVLVENLTDEEFQLLGSYVEEVETRAVLEPAFRRAVRLRWQSEGGRCAAAVAYGTVGLARDAEASEKGGAMQKLLSISVAMPSPTGVGRIMHAFAPGIGIAGIADEGARFSAKLIECPVSRRQQGDLRTQLAEADSLDDGVSESCEWLVVRNEDEVIEVRLRLLPQDPQVDSAEQPIHDAFDEESGEVVEDLTADEAEVRRLDGYRKVTMALNRQASNFEFLARQDVMDLQRLEGLPEKARLDLLLAVLAFLCRRRNLTLNRYCIQGADVPADEVARLDAALVKHVEHVYRAVVPLVGFREDRRIRNIIGLAQRHLRSSRSAEWSCDMDVPALISGVCSASASMAVPSMQTPVQTPRSTAASPANSAPADGAASPANSALNDGAVEEVESELQVESAAEWSPDRAWQLGREDEVVRFLGAVRLLDMDLVSSVAGAVEGLNHGRLFCPEVCCIVCARADNCFVALYRAGKEDKALELLGVASTSDLSPTEEKLEPNEIPLTVNSFVRGLEAADADKMEDDEDTVADPLALLRSTGSDLPRGWLVARELFAVVVGAGSGVFDARSRAAFFDLCAGFGVMPRLLARWEAEIGGALFEAMETEHIVEEQNKTRKNWNRAKVGAAAVGGGLLLAVTGGLAAPAVAAGISAVGGAAASAGAAVGFTHAGVVVGGAIAGMGTALSAMGTAGAAVLFGATGAGLTGWKMSRRWGELQEFTFQPLARNTTLKAVTIDIPATDIRSVRKLDAATEAGDGTVEEDMVVTAIGDREVAVHKGSVLYRRECLAGTSRPGTGRANGPECPRIVRFSFKREVDVAQRAVHLIIFCTGWLRNEEDFTQPWVDVAKQFFPSSGHLAIRWETEQLRRLGRMFQEMVTNQAASTAANLWIKSSAAAAVAGSAIMAMAVAWPISIVSAMANLDNAWLVAIERARVAGKCLAHVLADRHSVGQRPVTLVGHSVGARLLFYCLLELHDMGEFHAVDDVVLLGAPVSTSLEKWRKVRAVTSGRVINGYLRSDWVLAFFYRYMEWGLSVAGLTAVDVPGIESVNLAGLGISGHSEYPHHIADIFAKMRVGERDLHWRRDVIVNRSGGDGQFQW